MSASAEICLTEAAHWLAFGQWQHEAGTYAEAEAWQVDDPEGDVMFGSREAAWYASSGGQRIFQALAASPDPIGRPLKGSFEVAKRMVAVTGLPPMDLYRALQAHYGRLREALKQRHDALDQCGFTPIIRWAGNQEILVTGVGDGGSRRRVAPALFLENITFEPAAPQIVVERGGVWQTAKELRVLRQEIERRAAIEGLTPKRPIKSIKPEALHKWQEGINSASGFAPTKAEIVKWAKANNCPVEPTKVLARQLARNADMKIRRPGQRNSASK